MQVTNSGNVIQPLAASGSHYLKRQIAVQGGGLLFLRRGFRLCCITLYQIRSDMYPLLNPQIQKIIKGSSCRSELPWLTIARLAGNWPLAICVMSYAKTILY